jgi:hypothetical protein
MSTATNEAVGRGFFEAQDRLRGGPDPDLCTADYVARLASMPPMTFADHQGFATAFYGGFPDLEHAVEATFADGDKVAVRFRLRGTHRGEFFGIPATQKTIDVGAIAIVTVREGKVAEIVGEFDQLGMMRQLGVVP